MIRLAPLTNSQVRSFVWKRIQGKRDKQGRVWGNDFGSMLILYVDYSHTRRRTTYGRWVLYRSETHTETISNVTAHS